MASSKVMASSKPKSSDLTSSSSSRSRRPSDHFKNPSGNSANYGFESSLATPLPSLATPPPNMTVESVLRHGNNGLYSNSAPVVDSTLLDAQITLIDNPPVLPPHQEERSDTLIANSDSKTIDDVWKEMVMGKKEMKEEQTDHAMMTLEDYLAKHGAIDADDVDTDEIKMPLPLSLESGEIYGFDHGVGVNTPTQSNAFQMLDKVEGSIVAFGNGGGSGGGGGGGGRGKRGRSLVMEPLDKATQQRQRRMIKNRESAARSRERKQAYQVELESLAVRLEEENEQLLKEKEEWTKERYKQLMEKVVPVVEKRRPPRALRRVKSL